MTTTRAKDQDARQGLDVIERFCALFNRMTVESLDQLGDVYATDINFTDPFVSIHGLPALTEYFQGAYANVIECRFEFADTIHSGQDVCIPWVMKLRHKRIRGGELISVDGISRLRLKGDHVVVHRDYFDAGQLLYENLPVLGSAVRWIRKHAA